MDEAAKLCDRIIIMNHGKIIEKGNPSELVAKHVRKEVLEVLNTKESMDWVEHYFPDSRIDFVGDKIQVFANKPREVLTRIIKESSFKGVLKRESNLEDVFLKLAGRRLSD